MLGGETVVFKSCSPATYKALLAGAPSASEEICGYLSMPDKSGGKLPLVVISIGSQGFKAGREVLYSRALTSIGIAAFVVDSFTPRGFSETTSGQGRLSMAGSTADALFAIAHLRNDRRFDAGRIGILGFSRGGHAAIASHHRGLQRSVLGNNGTIGAHVALYPALNPRWRHPQPTEAPMLLLYGEADELVPPWKSRACAKEIADAGGSVELIGYPAAHHGFDSLTPAAPVTSANSSRCNTFIEDDGEIVDEATGMRAGSDWAGFLDHLQRTCGFTGGAVGYGPAPRDVAVARIQDFLRTTLSEGKS
jgi:dienelactone hydrolase